MHWLLIIMCITSSINSKLSLTIAILLNYYLVKNEGICLKARELFFNEACQTPSNVQLQYSELAFLHRQTLRCRIATRNSLSSFRYTIEFI